VVLHWVSQGVRIFRVDNPHTKPIDFWHWLIGRVKEVDPDVLFLAEAFTRPAIMHALGMVGFTQSYTYFAWRTTAHELREYCEELVASVDHMRPNFWPNTPDILPEHLQTGGPAMFKIRAILAALLSPSWGIYSGYELYEHVARPGVEEYIDNEKYQLRPRPWSEAERAGLSLAPFLATLNAIRRAHPALQQLRNLRFHDVDNENVLCWSKRDIDTGDTVLVLCSLDARQAHWTNTTLDMPALGFDWSDRMTVRDLLTGTEYEWGQHNAAHLDPHSEPAHIFAVRPAGTPWPGQLGTPATATTAPAPLAAAGGGAAPAVRPQTESAPTVTVRPAPPPVPASAPPPVPVSTAPPAPAAPAPRPSTADAASPPSAPAVPPTAQSTSEPSTDRADA
jgi:starch synthase (maltosyl-transferring)